MPVCAPFPAGALCNIKTSWGLKAVVEIAVLSCSVAKWKWLLQRKRNESCFKILLSLVIGLLTCHMDVAYDLEQVCGWRLPASRHSLIPHFKSIWGRAALPLECFCVLCSWCLNADWAVSVQHTDLGGYDGNPSKIYTVVQTLSQESLSWWEHWRGMHLGLFFCNNLTLVEAFHDKTFLEFNPVFLCFTAEITRKLVFSPPDGVWGHGYCCQWLENSCQTALSVRVSTKKILC